MFLYSLKNSLYIFFLGAIFLTFSLYSVTNATEDKLTLNKTEDEKLEIVFKSKTSDLCWIIPKIEKGEKTDLSVEQEDKKETEIRQFSERSDDSIKFTKFFHESYSSYNEKIDFLRSSLTNKLIKLSKLVVKRDNWNKERCEIKKGIGILQKLRQPIEGWGPQPWDSLEINIYNFRSNYKYFTTDQKSVIGSEIIWKYNKLQLIKKKLKREVNLEEISCALERNKDDIHTLILKEYFDINETRSVFDVLPFLYNLKYLNLEQFGVDNSGAAKIAELLKNTKNLLKLKLLPSTHGPSLFQSGGLHDIFEALITNQSLTEIDLTCCCSGRDNISLFLKDDVYKVLKFNKFLKIIKLANGDCHEDRIMEELSLGLKENKILDELDLSNNAISCEGLKYIRDALKVNTTLKILNLATHYFPEQEYWKGVLEILNLRPFLTGLNIGFIAGYLFDDDLNKESLIPLKDICLSLESNMYLKCLDISTDASACPVGSEFSRFDVDTSLIEELLKRNTIIHVSLDFPTPLIEELLKRNEMFNKIRPKLLSFLKGAGTANRIQNIFFNFQ